MYEKIRRLFVFFLIVLLGTQKVCADTISLKDCLEADNFIYIVGTDLIGEFVISSFTQRAVDKYDIVYTEKTYLGKDDPFVLGHKTGTLMYLSQAEVGDHIYITKDGICEIYEVIVSEYGIQNSAKTDIIGQTTKVSIWDTYENKTLHIYTCYGENKDGRWIVLAELL